MDVTCDFRERLLGLFNRFMAAVLEFKPMYCLDKYGDFQLNDVQRPKGTLILAVLHTGSLGNDTTMKIPLATGNRLHLLKFVCIFMFIINAFSCLL